MAKPQPTDRRADEIAAVRAALAAAHGSDMTFIDVIAALEKAVDLLLRELEATK